jgi:hypothetical protein
MESINNSHREYIKIIKRLTPEERLKKCFELNELTKQLFLTGLKNRFPNLSQEEIKKLYLKRINKCHNLDY